MEIHRKFTFDNPEDSYWNANGPANSSLFDEVPFNINAAAARNALEDLFESQVRFKNEKVASEDGSIYRDDYGHTLTNDHISLKLKVSEQETEIPSVTHIKAIPSAASIVSESSAGSFSSEPTTQLDYLRLKSEHRKLQKHLEYVRHERYRPAEPSVTVRRLICGEPVSFDLYRSKEDKMDLLDAAVDSLDGNAIIAVVLFLQRTLSERLFREILLENVVATTHYLSYLKQIKDYNQIIITLMSLGRYIEASMLELSIACNQKISEDRIQCLKCCFSKFIQSPTEHESHEAKLLSEHISLLERQIAIDANDEMECREDKEEKFEEFRKIASSLIQQPLLTTIYYCCFYHYDLAVNSFASPLSLKEVFQVTEKQYVWMAVSALSALRRWFDIERILTEKRSLSDSKIICPFGWNHLFAIILQNGEPPKEILCKLLRAIPSLKERRQFAELFVGGSDVVIECLLAQKDRINLKNFTAKLSPHTAETSKAVNAVNNIAYKWKN